MRADRAREALNLALLWARRARRTLLPGVRLAGHPRMLRAFEGLVTALRRERLTVRGHSMRLDPLDSLRLSLHGVYEPALTRYLEAVVRPGWSVVDVGANIGYFTLLLCRAVGPAGRVVAFEPDAEVAAILRENLLENGYPRAEVHQVALGPATASATLYSSPTNRGDNRTAAPEEGFEARPVRVVAFDELIGPRALDLVKIDVQGGELGVLLGMRQALAASPGVVLLVEWWPYGLARAGTDPRAVLDLLQEWGFSIHRLVDDDAGGRLEPVDVDALVRSLPPAGGEHVELVCRRTVTARSG